MAAAPRRPLPPPELAAGYPPRCPSPASASRRRLPRWRPVPPRPCLAPILQPCLQHGFQKLRLGTLSAFPQSPHFIRPSRDGAQSVPEAPSPRLRCNGSGQGFWGRAGAARHHSLGGPVGTAPRGRSQARAGLSSGDSTDRASRGERVGRLCLRPLPPWGGPASSASAGSALPPPRQGKLSTAH